MKRLFLRTNRWRLFFFVVFSIGFIFLINRLGLTTSKKHNFEGKCLLCHTEIPPKGASYEKIVLADEVDGLCAQCHDIDKRTSHPVGIKPQTHIPLERYLDSDGRLSCVTCHDVHKEEKVAFSREELKGLLRGHAQGRSFCFICHNKEVLGADWRHELVVTYAHLTGELIQSKEGLLLDKFSVECLSCHDGVISMSASVDVRAGEFRHSIGLSHPVGVEYPRDSLKNDFVMLEALPEEIKLFGGKVGCLSCHNPYREGGDVSFLVMDNVKSALCMGCHRK